VRRFAGSPRRPFWVVTKHDPFLAGAPWVLKEDDLFRMWYVSGTEWTPDRDGGSKPIHYYTIKHDVSENGVDWQTNDHLCLPYSDGEQRSPDRLSCMIAAVI
jgi:hypothetical protein